jgi:MtN3 and saliva related transmembrane protein
VSNTLASVIGSLAALASISSFVPQIFKIIRTRDASSVSVRMYLLTVTAFLLWTAYGGLIGSLPVMASNIAALVLSSITLYLKWHFRG